MLHLRSLSTGFVFVLSSFAVAQSSEPQAAAPGSAMNESFGVVDAEGRLEALGPAFKARFEPGEVTFTPALGRAAPRNFPATLRCESVRRAGPPLAGDRSAAPISEGLRVSYDHGSFVERYDVERDGIELSFALDELPAGAGELVVRLALDTELEGELLDAGLAGVRFTHSSFGGVEIGAVTGVDASGATSPGRVRFDSGSLEFVLPAEFVDRAQLPLIVDPFIQTFTVAGSDNTDSAPDVSYDRDTDSFLVVWTRTYSLSDQDTHGRRVRPDGTLLGNVLPIETGSAPSIRPKVANVNLREKWVVVWIQPDLFVPYQVYGAAVNTALGGGAIGPKTLIDSPPGTPGDLYCDIGGEYEDDHDDVVVVFERGGLGVLSREVQVAADGTLTPLGAGPTTLFSNSATEAWVGPAITKSDGEHNRYLVVALNALSNRIAAQALNGNGAPLHFAVDAAPNGALDVSNIDVDGDGAQFLVTWQQDEAGSSEHDIWGRAMTLDGAGLHANAIGALVASANIDSWDPKVAYTGHDYALAWIGDVLATSGVYTADVDATSMTRNNPALASSIGAIGAVEIASRYAGGANGATPQFDALAVWHGMFGADLDVVAGYFESRIATPYCTAGTTTNGCTAELTGLGVPSATANAGFDLSVTGAEGAKFGILFYGVSGRAESPWGASSSFLCVKSPTQRTLPQMTSGAAGSCNGGYSLDFNAYIANHPGALGAPFSSGDVVDAQFWFRDPPSPKTTHLSNGLEFVVFP